MSGTGKSGNDLVLSWRLSRKLKAELEAAAKEEKASVDTLLARAVREWLAERRRVGSGRVGFSGDDRPSKSPVGFAEEAKGIRERGTACQGGRIPAKGQHAPSWTRTPRSSAGCARRCLQWRARRRLGSALTQMSACAK